MDVRSNGGRVRLHLAEADSGAPVLLLHGWPQHWWCWRWVIEQLRDQYRLLVPDLRVPGPVHDLSQHARKQLAHQSWLRHATSPGVGSAARPAAPAPARPAARPGRSAGRWWPG
jgi:hypothetical protein